MKNFLLALLLLPLIGNSQPIQIKSFYGIKFGASRQEALQTAATLGATVSSIDQFEELAYLNNLNFAGTKSRMAYLKFVDNKFYEGIIEFDVNQTNFAHLYDKMKLALSKSYGYGKDYSWMENPFYFGDGNEFFALQQKKGKFCHVWAKGKQITSDDFIIMEIGADRVLRIVFQNHQYASMASRKFGQLGANHTSNK